MFARRRRDRELRIDVSALIDVVFLLLIFFMVTTTFAERPTVDIELPSADGERQQLESALPEVAIGEDGVVRLDGELVEVADLASRVRALVEAGEAGERQVVVRADGRARVNVMVQVMDQLRRADVGVMHALTEPVEGDE